jgi:aspartyl/asparaginyl beta-hydroxylase (cupin superfamily)
MLKFPCSMRRTALLWSITTLASAWMPPQPCVAPRARACRVFGSCGLRAVNAAGGLFEPTYETRILYQEAAQQMQKLHAGKCRERKIKELDEAFWCELDVRLQRIPDSLDADSDRRSLWRFDHFLTKQKIIALPLTGRTRIDGVSRRSLGPLKDLDEGRRQVRAAAYYPGLSHQPFHDFEQFGWLRALHANPDTIRTELEQYLSSPHNKWAGNNCEDFDQYGWTQISLNTFGQSHGLALKHFPKTMALLANVPYGPRDLCIVRQRANSGLPRHSDQRNYMLTAHIVLKSPDAVAAQQAKKATATATGEARPEASAVSETPEIQDLRAQLMAAEKRLEQLRQSAAAVIETERAAEEGETAGAAEQGEGVVNAQAGLDQRFKCSVWCDGQEREWRQGGASTVIDTTYWHHTFNAHQEDVYVLLIDFWHPDLSAREVEALKVFTELEGIYLKRQGINAGLEFRDVI